MVSLLTLFLITISLIFLLGLGIVAIFWKQIKIKYYKSKYKENFLKANLIGENNRIFEYYTFIKRTKTFVYEDEEYIVDTKEVYYIEGMPTSFYIKGNPSPLSLRKAINGVVEINSENLKLVLDQKLIKDMLSEEANMKILMIICIITLVVTILIALKIFGIFDKLTQGKG